MIPESVSVEAALLKNTPKTGIIIRTLQELMNLDNKLVNQLCQSDLLPVFTEGIAVEFSASQAEGFLRFILKTNIRVYQSHQIGFNASSLTIPFRVIDLQEISHWPARFRFWYQRNANPGFMFVREQE